jgi:hypothetical protein
MINQHEFKRDEEYPVMWVCVKCGHKAPSISHKAFAYEEMPCVVVSHSYRTIQPAQFPENIPVEKIQAAVDSVSINLPDLIQNIEDLFGIAKRQQSEIDALKKMIIELDHKVFKECESLEKEIQRQAFHFARHECIKSKTKAPYEQT